MHIRWVVPAIVVYALLSGFFTFLLQKSNNSTSRKTGTAMSVATMATPACLPPSGAPGSRSQWKWFLWGLETLEGTEYSGTPWPRSCLIGASEYIQCWTCAAIFNPGAKLYKIMRCFTHPLIAINSPWLKLLILLVQKYR